MKGVGDFGNSASPLASSYPPPPHKPAPPDYTPLKGDQDIHQHPQQQPAQPGETNRTSITGITSRSQQNQQKPACLLYTSPSPRDRG